MNLAQTKFLSALGIVMILFGILIVAASMYIYLWMWKLHYYMWGV